MNRSVHLHVTEMQIIFILGMSEVLLLKLRQFLATLISVQIASDLCTKKYVFT